MMEKFTVDIVADTYEEAELLAFSEDLAWEATILASQAEGIEIGSDEFVQAFTHLKARYAECAESYGYLRHICARTLTALMDAGMAITYPGGRCTCDNCMTAHIDTLVMLILGQATALYSVGPLGWIRDNEWVKLPESDRTTTFQLIKPNMGDNEHNDN